MVINFAEVSEEVTQLGNLADIQLCVSDMSSGSEMEEILKIYDATPPKGNGGAPNNAQGLAVYSDRHKVGIVYPTQTGYVFDVLPGIMKSNNPIYE